MDKCIGLISGANIENNYGALCVHRPVYMLPFGGRYRLIDFSVSNMVNYGIKTVAIFTGEKIRSTMDHIGDGKPWDLNRRFNGLVLFPPVTQGYPINLNGDIAQFFTAMDFFEQVKEKYIFLNHPNILAKIDLNEAFHHFIETDADITLIYKKQEDPWGEYINCDKINISENGEVLNLGMNLGTETNFMMSLKTGFLKKEVFIKIVKEAIEKGDFDNLQDAIMNNKDKYKINSYEFKGHTENIRNLKSFYDANLNLLKKSIAQELFYERGPIFTQTKDEPSTLYTETANVQNSHVANGCIIEGSVENSIIFRGVKIGKGAVVKNSIVMQKSEIQENASVVNSILDKNAIIGEGVRIAGSTLIPYVVEKAQKIRKD
ncbi:MAG: glucose-1-phosphate adenylyltransferase subunit GlgD [Gudongella sp.]|nr:glucose-1-phosphate adenylyltransferase subunit GlgD [Gudongella sp.]